MHCGAGIFYNISQKHVLVLEKPLSENPDLFDGFDQANLDSEKISQQDFCDKKGSVVALKAYDEIVIDICGTAWEILTETKVGEKIEKDERFYFGKILQTSLSF